MSTRTWIGTTTAFATATNWSASTAPITGDTAIFDQTSIGPMAGSDQSAITLAQLTIKSTVPTTSYVGSATTELKIGATLWRIGDAALGPIAGSFPLRVTLDTGTAASSGVVVGTSSSTVDTGQEPVRIKGVNAANTIIVQAGLVGIATNAATDVATYSEIDVLGGQANIGSGVTLTTVKQTAGIANIFCAVTTLRQIAGTLTTSGSGAVTTAYAGGTSTYNSTGTITTLEVPGGGVADFNQDFQAKTVTTIKLFKGATLRIGSHITVTNPIQYVECTLTDVVVATRQNVSIVLAYL